MIPYTFPSVVQEDGTVACRVRLITDVTGLTAWSDYTPIKFVTDAAFINTYENAGSQALEVLTDLTGLVSGVDYILVYEDTSATKPWSTDIGGYIPCFGDSFSPLALFAANEPGVWYDPSDMSTMFTDAAGTTPVTAVEQGVGLILDKSRGLVLGPELVTNGGPFASTTGWTGLNSAILSVTNSRLRSAGNLSVGFPFAASSVATVIGRSYRFTATAIFISGSDNNVYIQKTDTQPANQNVNSVGSPSGPGRTISIVFEATATTSHIRLLTFDANDIYEWDNISVRELPGAHASQTTATSRPVLSARYNLLTGTDGFTGATITPATGLVVVATGQLDPRGGNTARQIRNTTTTEQHRLFVGTTAPGRTLYSVEVKNVDAGFVQLSCAGSVVAAFGATFDLAAKTFALVGNTLPTASIDELPNGFLRLNVLAPANETATNNAQFYVLEASTSTSNPFTTGTGKSVIVAGADLRVSNVGAGLPAYQRVNTSTDYDSGPLFPRYLKFDGIDDSLVTPTITPGIDKAQVFAGVRKLSDAAGGYVTELSANAGAQSGAFYLAAPNGTAPLGQGNYNFFTRGTAVGQAYSGNQVAYASPQSAVLTGIGDISGDLATLRVNGTQAAQSTADQGTGNYLAYPLFIGRRNNASLPFNGNLHTMIVRFGPNLTADQITQTETYVAGKTGVTL